MNATIKNLLLWMVILVLIILAWNVFKTATDAKPYEALIPAPAHA